MFRLKRSHVLTAFGLLALSSVAGCGQAPSSQNYPPTAPSPITVPSSTSESPALPTETVATKENSWCNKQTQVEAGITNITENQLWISSEYFNGMNHGPTLRHICQNEVELFSFGAPDSYAITTTGQMAIASNKQGKIVIGGFKPSIGHPLVDEKPIVFQKIVYTQDLSDPKTLPTALYYRTGDKKAETELMGILKTVTN